MRNLNLDFLYMRTSNIPHKRVKIVRHSEANYCIKRLEMGAATVDFCFFHGSKHIAQDGSVGFDNKVELFSAVVIDQNGPVRIIIPSGVSILNQPGSFA
jgi:hypothetical protein